jgi:DNA-damage-inducible protein D
MSEKMNRPNIKKKNTTKLAVFQKKEIRKTIYNNEWWFSIIDVIEVLTNSKRARKYWNDLKKKLIDEGYFEVSEKIGQLKLQAPDGKMRNTDCANTETLFRIIQSIPSPKAENNKIIPICYKFKLKSVG